MILPTQDDYIFNASGDVKATFVQKSKITGAKKRTFATVCKACIEGLFGRFRSLPVTRCYPGPANPDLSDLSA